MTHLDAQGITTVTLVPDLSGWARAIRRMLTETRRAAEHFARTFAPFVERMREEANSPRTVAGLEARYAVRAGLDPAYATPAALDRLVGQIMGGHARRPGDRALHLLTSESRSLVAAAAIRGWCYSHGDGPAIVAWHRLLGTTTVVVTRG